MMMMMKILWYLDYNDDVDDDDDNDENEKAKEDGAHSADCCASMLRCWFQRVEKPCKIKFKYKGRSLRDQKQIQMYNCKFRLNEMRKSNKYYFLQIK